MKRTTTTPTIVVQDDHDDVPPTQEARAFVCDPGTTLNRTLGLVNLAREVSGVTAIMLELVRSQGLFRAKGHPTMKAYAAETLGITNKNTLKKALSAGRVAWEVYPDLAEDVASRILAHPGGRLPQLPPVPNQSALEILPQAIERGNDPQLAERVRHGQVTVKALTQLARPLVDRSSKKTNKPKRNFRSNSRSTLTSVRMPNTLLERLRTLAGKLGVPYQALLKGAVEQGLPRAVKAVQEQQARNSRGAE